MRRARRPRLRGATTKAMPVSIVLGAKRRVRKQSGDLRGARSDPRPARVGDRAPAPPAPEGLAGLRIASYAAHVSGPPADVVVFMNTGTRPAASARARGGAESRPAPAPTPSGRTSEDTRRAGPRQVRTRAGS